MIENCDEISGKLKPAINLNNCGGKAVCVPVCPYDVLEMKPISEQDKKELNLKGKLKTFFKKHKAYVTDESLCHACGICVQICPEQAIKLVRNN